MSIKYAIQFAALSAAAVVAATLGPADIAWRILFLWIAFAFGIVAVAYALNRPRVLMKRDAGTQPMYAWIVLWPYLLLARFTFALYRRSTTRKVAAAEVVPGLWFARRLTRSDLAAIDHRWSSVLDLAGEFPKIAVDDAAYHSLPLLDGAAPSAAQIKEGIAWIDEQMKHGDVLVHCALGHGRTGSIVVGWLIRHGHVPDANAGIEFLTKRRPGFGMSKAQIARVDAVSRGDSLSAADE